MNHRIFMPFTESGEELWIFTHPRAKRLVLEGLELHRDELLENWQLARERKPLRRVKPLE